MVIQVVHQDYIDDSARVDALAIGLNGVEGRFPSFSASYGLRAFAVFFVGIG